MRKSRANSSRTSATMHSTAPAAAARSRNVASSMVPPSWPTLTARAITSTPMLSIIQRTATEVSSPPLYASTTRFATLSSFGSSEVREGGELLGDLRATDALGRDHEERVVAGDGAEDLRQRGTVECRADDVRRARRGAEHDDVAGVSDLHDPVAEHPAQVVFRRALLLGEVRYGVDALAARGAHLDGTDLLEVARHGRLRCV